ncbi:TPA: PTS sugar transporter subunit IIC [Streptococcus suis]|nr:PTS sugar transporter subunit IIC [Streptococcus suis]HEM3649036.1 PTS sugar transporter subunit IIC [Streptococcus suis]
MVFDKVNGPMEKIQRVLVPYLGKLEGNFWFQGTKTLYAKLTIVLFVNSLLAGLVLLNRNGLYDTKIDLIASSILQLFTENFSLIVLGLSGYIFFKEENRHQSFVVSCLLFLITKMAVGESLAQFDLLVVVVSLVLGIGVIQSYQQLSKVIKKSQSFALNSLDYIFQTIYIVGFLMLTYALVKWLAHKQIVDLILAIKLDHPSVVFVVVFCEMFLWYLGVNGYGILAPIVLFFAINQYNLNLVSLSQGKDVVYIFTPNLWDYFFSATGSGLTGALVCLALVSRNSSLKKLGKAAWKGAIFSLSEPIVFGIPIAMNPYFFIPFVIGTPVIAVLQWFVFEQGWVSPPVLYVADMPLPFAPLIATLDLRAILLVGVTILLAVIIYYPFFKLYEKNYVEEVEDDCFSELDLDF